MNIGGRKTVEGSSSHAPIALFAHTRTEHFRRTLSALQSNPEARESELYVFIDGPRNKADISAIRSVREACEQIGGFAEVTVTSRSTNAGLARSIIDGVTQVLDQHGKAIVLEDDIVVSPHFLRYMNDALQTYASDERVASVHGYVYPLELTLPETFFLRGADCWGWATWARSWALLEQDGSKLLRELDRSGLQDEFDRHGAIQFRRMLQDQVNGLIDSWAIRWHASTFLANRLTLYPGRSLAQNIGNDGSGTHTGITNQYDTRLSTTPVQVSRIEVEESASTAEALEMYFKLTEGREAKPWYRRIYQSVRSRLAFHG